MNKYNGVTFKERCTNTIAVIKYSNSFEKYNELFNKGIDILKEKIKTNNKELNNDELLILEDIFTIIELEE